MRLYWHRRDLRTRDNVGLAAAARDDTVVPVYVHDADAPGPVGGRQRAFLMRGVRALNGRYRDLGSDLVVRAGAPAEVLPDIADEYGAGAIYHAEHYRPSRRDRGRRVEEAFAGTDVAVEPRTDLVLVDPGRLDPAYPNHSRFYDDWQAVPKPAPYAEPDSGSLASLRDDGTVPVPEADIDLPEAGYEAARDRYDAFLEAGIRTYRDTRDDLRRAVEAPTQAVSRMSPYLAAGALGIREVWADATDVYEAVRDDERRQVDKYRYELSWREGNYHLLYHNPDIGVENYVDFPNEVAWRNDEAALEAWKAGETGYPLVDAGMRQLDREGYVHNRPRQVVASFLTKHLLVDWREGARYFVEKLVDHDYAANHANWQWVASTGTDSVDVRIFDPVSQAAKYDDDAAFVHEYVPELRDVPAGKVIDWPTLPAVERDDLAPEYPDPVVDRDEGYERARRVFETALGKR